MTETVQERQHLRQSLRARRRALNTTEQQHHAQQLVRQLMKVPQFMRAQYFALYMANDGEINPWPVAEQLWKMKRKTYLPVLRPDRQGELWFVEFTAETPMKTNQFGIPEPDFRQHHRLPAARLDMALMPLVGFDRTGARLGMGGGYYDRSFAFKQRAPKGRPYLIGLAHACQEVESLALANWDIPLFGVATEREFILCSN